MVFKKAAVVALICAAACPEVAASRALLQTSAQRQQQSQQQAAQQTNQIAVQNTVNHFEHQSDEQFNQFSSELASSTDQVVKQINAMVPKLTTGSEVVGMMNAIDSNSNQNAGVLDSAVAAAFSTEMAQMDQQLSGEIPSSDAHKPQDIQHANQALNSNQLQNFHKFVTNMGNKQANIYAQLASDMEQGVPMSATSEATVKADLQNLDQTWSSDGASAEAKIAQLPNTVQPAPAGRR